MYVIFMHTVAHRINTTECGNVKRLSVTMRQKNQVSILLQHRKLFKLAWHWQLVTKNYFNGDKEQNE